MVQSMAHLQAERLERYRESCTSRKDLDGKIETETFVKTDTA